MGKVTKITFWSLIANFVLLIGVFFVNFVQEIFIGSELFLLPCITFSVLGLILFIQSIKLKSKLKQKRALLITSIGALGFFVSIFLHNAFYVLAEVSASVLFIPTLFQFLEGIFFLAAIFLSPAVFLFGSIFYITIIIRSK